LYIKVVNDISHPELETQTMEVPEKEPNGDAATKRWVLSSPTFWTTGNTLCPKMVVYCSFVM